MSFEETYKAYYPELIRYGRQLNVNRGDLDDVVQETFLKYHIELEKNIDTKDFKDNKNLNDKIKIANQHLKQLSEIQITEGNRQLSISQKAVRNVELYTQIEIYILIFLAVIIQIIIMYQPKND